MVDIKSDFERGDGDRDKLLLGERSGHIEHGGKRERWSEWCRRS